MYSELSEKILNWNYYVLLQRFTLPRMSWIVRNLRSGECQEYSECCVKGSQRLEILYIHILVIAVIVVFYQCHMLKLSMKLGYKRRTSRKIYVKLKFEAFSWQTSRSLHFGSSHNFMRSANLDAVFKKESEKCLGKIEKCFELHVSKYT